MTRAVGSPYSGDRRRFLGLSLTGLLVSVPTARAQSAAGAGHAHAQLPAAVSLPDEVAAALRRGQPLVVMASLDGCPHCRAAREQHLLPLLAQGLPIVQVDWRSDRALRDFSGAPTTHDQMIRRWGVSVAPTLLFFGPGGREVAERMAGAYLPDFYGAYLEARLEAGRRAIRG